MDDRGRRLSVPVRMDLKPERGLGTEAEHSTETAWLPGHSVVPSQGLCCLWGLEPRETMAELAARTRGTVLGGTLSPRKMSDPLTVAALAELGTHSAHSLPRPRAE